MNLCKTCGTICPFDDERTECDAYAPMTNENWFISLSTEEKAEWIAKQKCDGCNDEPYDDKHGTCKYCMTKKTEQIREWLKQPHTVKEYNDEND